MKRHYQTIIICTLALISYLGVGAWWYAKGLAAGAAASKTITTGITDKDLQAVRDEAKYYETMMAVEQQTALRYYDLYIREMAKRKPVAQHEKHIEQVLLAAGFTAWVDTLLARPGERSRRKVEAPAP